MSSPDMPTTINVYGGNLSGYWDAGPETSLAPRYVLCPRREDGGYPANTRPAEGSPEEIHWLRGFAAGVEQMREDFRNGGGVIKDGKMVYDSHGYFADALVREADTCTEIAERARARDDVTGTQFHRGEAFALRDVARRIRAGEFPPTAPDAPRGGGSESRHPK